MPAGVAVLDFGPDEATYKPGAPIALRLQASAAQPGTYPMTLTVMALDRPVAVLTPMLHIPAAATAVTVTIPLTLPATAPRGYGADLVVGGADGRPAATASTALDVLDGWWQMPRYGFFADYRPDETPAQSAAIARSLAAYHVDVIQFYDWMYRHVQYLPPQDPFVDPLGRTLAMATVRDKIAAAHAEGMAALAYGAVYGADPGFWAAHKTWGMYDLTGQPYNLDQFLYLMDIRLGQPWAAHILDQYAVAVRDVGFDGIHIDQYGFPKVAYTGPPAAGVTPTPLILDNLFPPVVNAAADRVASIRPDARVIFNAVGGWPIDKVGPTRQAALYLEIWPPDLTYDNLALRIAGARSSRAPGNQTEQVILAAYLTPFLNTAPDGTAGSGGDAAKVTGAENAARLASAAIFASGGFHLLLGEQNGVLADPYYPKYGHLRPAFVPTMRAYYDFQVRYENLLADPAATDVDADALQSAVTLTAGGAPVDVSGHGRQGKVWVVLRRGAAGSALSLINLVGVRNSLWNAPKETPTALDDLDVRLTLSAADAARVDRVALASPDAPGPPIPLAVMRTPGADGQVTLQVHVPHLAYWDLLLLLPPAGAR